MGTRTFTIAVILLTALGSLALAALVVVLPVACRRGAAVDSSLFTVEIAGGVRVVHNYAPQLGSAAGARLELVRKIGELETRDERQILYDPADAVRLAGGDILILERGGCRVKRYGQEGGFVSAFGQKGKGPGDFVSPYALKLNPEGTTLWVADYLVSRFSLEGLYLGGFRPARNPSGVQGGSVGELHRTSGFAVLPGGLVVLPSPSSMWAESGEDKLLSVYDDNGALVRSFGDVESFEDLKLTLNANIAIFSADKDGAVYVAYAYRNRIDRYAPDGQMSFSTDRHLDYEPKAEMKSELFKSGAMTQEFAWPSVTSVTKGIGVDQRGRIWVLTFLRQPDRFGNFLDADSLTPCYEFDVFDAAGIHLFRVPFPNVRADRLSIADDRLYLVDAGNEACVYEYRIVD